MNRPVVSIIIPTFNRCKALRECLTYLLNQTMPRLEILIVDDGSNDGTESLIHSTFNDPRIRYIRKEKNEGAYAARNTGMKAAQGDFVLHWDSDDILYPNALERLLTVIDTHPMMDIVSATARFLRNSREQNIPSQPTGKRTFADIMSETLPENAVITLVRRSKIGHVAFHAPHIDYTFYYRLAKTCNWYHLNETLGDIRLAYDSISETCKRQIPNIDRSIRRAPHLDAFLKEIGPDILQHNPTRYGGICYGIAVGFLLADNIVRARSYAKKAKIHLPHVLHQCFFLFTFLPYSSVMLRALFTIKRYIVLTRQG